MSSDAPSPMAAFDMTGKVAVITGGASGIGEAACEIIAVQGGKVVVADLNIEGATSVAKRIEEAGGTAAPFEVNITSKDQNEALADFALATFGGVHVWGNIAGIAAEGKVADITETDLDRAISINLKGTVFGCQAAMRAMRTTGEGGSIINTASASIDIGVPGYAMYAMTKAAVAQLTMSMVWEVGRDKIRVNTIAPGSTITPFTSRHAYEEDGTLNQDKYDEFVKRMKNISPLRRVGEAQDQANLILFLSSDAGAFCTGQVWRSNGGQAIVR
jgi:3-oxoacyl-[acyl-carrier protein] reductase